MDNLENKIAPLDGRGEVKKPRSHSSNVATQCNAPFDSIDETIAGQADGSRFVRDLRDGIAAPDAMFVRLQEIATDTAKLRGFCRALQKALERSV